MYLARRVHLSNHLFDKENESMSAQEKRKYAAKRDESLNIVDEIVADMKSADRLGGAEIATSLRRVLIGPCHDREGRCDGLKAHWANGHWPFGIHSPFQWYGQMRAELGGEKAAEHFTSVELQELLAHLKGIARSHDDQAEQCGHKAKIPAPAKTTLPRTGLIHAVRQALDEATPALSQPSKDKFLDQTTLIDRIAARSSVSGDPENRNA